MTIRILTGDCREVLKTLPDKSIHTCVTSPPYFGLRDYGMEAQIGLEASIEEYIAAMVEVFREVGRVLRDDGVLWLNLGDSYASSGGHSAQGVTSARIGRSNVDDQNKVRGFRPGLNGFGIKDKNILGIPWRVAFALQEDGWNLRQDIIWSKTQPMPESVTDRFTRAHEYIFMLTKGAEYFFDQEAIKEDAVSDHSSGNGFAGRQGGSEHMPMSGGAGTEEEWTPGGKRNKRSVWTVGTETFSYEFCTACRRLYGPSEKRQLPIDVIVCGGEEKKLRRCRCGRNDAWLSHFATFPPTLIEPCIKAAVSERGYCPEPGCGAPHERILEKHRVHASNAAKAGTTIEGKGHVSSQVRKNHDVRNGPVTVTETVGWRQTCGCKEWEPGRGVVLDPFGGAGTTALVANRLGHDAVLIELNPDYADLAENRIRDEAGFLAKVIRG